MTHEGDRMKREWCQEKYTGCMNCVSQPNMPKPRRVRCPACKKRFMTVWRTCGDYWCWHEYMPPHKKIVKNKKITGTLPAKQG